MNEEFKIIILANFNKEELPNKAMIDIHGEPMIQHVFECARSSGAAEIVIATDSAHVGMMAEEFGAIVCMLADEEATDTEQLVAVIDKMGWGDDTMIVNFPGDAPVIPGAILQQVAVNLMNHAEADCSCLYTLVSREDAEQQESVNLVVDNNSFVMYFSHHPIPYHFRTTANVIDYKRYNEVIAYRAGLLRIYNNLPEAELDQTENIKQLKLLYNGLKIHAAEAGSSIGHRIFTEKDVEKVKNQIAQAI